MKTLKIIFGILVTLILLFLSIYAYYGGFKTLTITVATQGGETLVYKELVGDYSQSGKVMDEIYYSLKVNDKIETQKGFGIYYDNPQLVEKNKLRSDVGCIVENSDTAKLVGMKTSFKIKRCPVQNYITTEFPHKGSISVLVSVLKVYPALANYALQKGYIMSKNGIMEIYDMPNKKIYYRMSIEQ